MCCSVAVLSGFTFIGLLEIQLWNFTPPSLTAKTQEHCMPWKADSVWLSDISLQGSYIKDLWYLLKHGHILSLHSFRLAQLHWYIPNTPQLGMQPSKPLLIWLLKGWGTENLTKKFALIWNICVITQELCIFPVYCIFCHLSRHKKSRLVSAEFFSWKIFLNQGYLISKQRYSFKLVLYTILNHLNNKKAWVCMYMSECLEDFVSFHCLFLKTNHSTSAL